MATGMEQLQKRWQSEVEKMKGIQREMQRQASARQQLEAQLRENTAVLAEIAPLANVKETNVFKLVGPVLIPQPAGEAKQTVEKRLSYIESEAKRTDSLISDAEKRQTAQREVLAKLQQQMQQAQVRSAARS